MEAGADMTMALSLPFAFLRHAAFRRHYSFSTLEYNNPLSQLFPSRC